MALSANEVKMPGVTVGRFEPRASLAEIDLARDARVDHPLQRTIDRGATDAGRLAPDELDELVGADMPFVTEEDGDDLIALARPLAAGRDRNAQTVSRR